jgi:chromosomal replication initiator protein
MSAYAARIAAETIIDRASELTDFSVAAITGPRRFAELSEVRFACMAAMRSLGMTLPQIGRALGGRDHQTVSHGLLRAKSLLNRRAFAELVKALEVT